MHYNPQEKKILKRITSGFLFNPLNLLKGDFESSYKTSYVQFLKDQNMNTTDAKSYTGESRMCGTTQQLMPLHTLLVS